MDWSKRSHIKMSQYFSKPFRSFGWNINVKVALSNYATKTDLKNVTHVDTSGFDKLAPIPADLSKLSDVVKNDVVEKSVYEKMVAKVNNIDTSDFVLKTKYQTHKTELEKNIPNVTDFVKKAHWIRKQNSRCK